MSFSATAPSTPEISLTRPKFLPSSANQFGGSGGLPIRKGRTFVFGDYEGLRQSLGVTTVDTVPSAAARNGHLSTGSVTVAPTVARFLAAFYPLPNGPLLEAATPAFLRSRRGGH